MDPVTLVIFGGAGDLAQRKLLPALYNLHAEGLLPSPFAVVGTGRREMSDDAFRQFAREGVERFSKQTLDESHWQTFAGMLFFVTASIGEADALVSLGARLDRIEHERGLPGNRIYYLAVPPPTFVPTVRQLQHARFVAPADAKPFARLVVEKPIGRDLASAMAINNAIAEVFDERQTFRIDHYLGKETVQNILVLRFANGFFEPLFNHRFVDHVQITVAEAEGIGTRAGYYEQSGAVRDMVQNHLLQLLALVAMEPPYSLDADVVRDEKLEIIQALRPLDVAQVVRAQYAAGEVEGKAVPAYAEESGVAAGSRIETFVALQLFIDNWRWAGVPFFLRTGKRLAKRTSEISIHLKAVPPILFNRDPARPLESNVIALHIQPDESFSLFVSSKVPGPRLKILPAEMDLDYCRAFQTRSPEAYERLLLDVMLGDATLFMRRDAVETSWKWITPVLDHWDRAAGRTSDALSTYAAGSTGPAEADRLIESTGRHWRAL